MCAHHHIIMYHILVYTYIIPTIDNITHIMLYYPCTNLAIEIVLSYSLAVGLVILISKEPKEQLFIAGDRGLPIIHIIYEAYIRPCFKLLQSIAEFTFLFSVLHFPSKLRNNGFHCHDTRARRFFAQECTNQI